MPADACQHTDHHATATLVRISDDPIWADGWYLELSAACTTCLAPLQFTGLPIGENGLVPSVNGAGTRVTLPCRPLAVAEQQAERTA